MPVPSESVIYQLRIVLLGISPLIWRRLLVRSDASIADLHHYFQIAFGWSDFHLHRFLLHGQHYGISYLDGLSFRDDPDHVKLSDFRFRTQEKFIYEYDFGNNWQHQVRVEAILTFDSKRFYPVCTGGKRAAPPEDCGGAWAYLALRQQYSAWHVLERLSEILHDEDIRDHIEELSELLRWLKVDRFDRRAVNRRLKKYANKDEAWQWQ